MVESADYFAEHSTPI